MKTLLTKINVLSKEAKNLLIAGGAIILVLGVFLYFSSDKAILEIYSRLLPQTMDIQTSELENIRPAINVTLLRPKEEITGKISFLRDNEIWIVDASGENEQQLTDSGNTIGLYEWAMNGDFLLISFVEKLEDASGDMSELVHGVDIINVDSGEQRTIIPGANDESDRAQYCFRGFAYPTVELLSTSPSGQLVAIAQHDIYVYNISDNTLEVLYDGYDDPFTNDPFSFLVKDAYAACVSRPSFQFLQWSPDNKHILVPVQAWESAYSLFLDLEKESSFKLGQSGIGMESTVPFGFYANDVGKLNFLGNYNSDSLDIFSYDAEWNEVDREVIKETGFVRTLKFNVNTKTFYFTGASISEESDWNKHTVYAFQLDDQNFYEHSILNEQFEVYDLDISPNGVMFIQARNKDTDQKTVFILNVSKSNTFEIIIPNATHAKSVSPTTVTIQNGVNTEYTESTISDTTLIGDQELPKEVVELIPHASEVHCLSYTHTVFSSTKLSQIENTVVINYLEGLPNVNKVNEQTNEDYQPQLNIHQICEITDNLNTVIYSYGTSAGGMYTFHLGVIDSEEKVLVSTAIDSEKLRKLPFEGKGPYHSCYRFLATSNEIYILCGGGDAGYSFSALHKASYDTGMLETLMACQSSLNENMETKEFICE